MNVIENFLSEAIKKNVSDLHVTVSQKIFFRKDGDLNFADEKILSREEIDEFINLILNEEQKKNFY